MRPITRTYFFYTLGEVERQPVERFLNEIERAAEEDWTGSWFMWEDDRPCIECMVPLVNREYCLLYDNDNMTVMCVECAYHHYTEGIQIPPVLTEEVL